MKKEKHYNATHEGTGTREHETWRDMIKRCHRSWHYAYKYYGARGIKVCERWHKFENFRDDMGPKPEGYTIERIDNDKDYSPENCKWASMKEQSYNKRNSRKIEYDGQAKSIFEWGELSVVSARTFYNRINLGWDMKRALTEPLNRKPYNI